MQQQLKLHLAEKSLEIVMHHAYLIFFPRPQLIWH